MKTGMIKSGPVLSNNETANQNNNSVQLKTASAPSSGINFTVQKKANNTGMPDQLKSGIESLSGISMNDVKVHYNSSQPAQLNAHAYAQGSNIHIGPGQEKHLPHEAWHVVQQKQGRVQPTVQMNNVGINDNKGLETEADVMGAKAIQMKAESTVSQLKTGPKIGDFPVQLKTTVKNQEQTLKGKDASGVKQEQLAGKKMTAVLDPMYPIKGSKPGAGKDYEMYGALNRDWSTTFIKGHLLNDNLGGLGIRENLFPITADANKAHLSNVEQHVKQAVIVMNEKIEEDHDFIGSYVEYEVEANPAHKNDFVAQPESQLVCNAKATYKDSSTNDEYETPIVMNTVIDSHPVSQDNDGHNAKLSGMGWGSVGSGLRSNGPKDEGKLNFIDDSGSGGYYHVEFADPSSNKYLKWKYQHGSWQLINSEEQKPITIKEE